MNLRKHERFFSHILKNERDLIVYLPPGYEEMPDRRFPVLYLQDGQNLFDGNTAFIPGNDWRVGQTADHFIGTGVVEPLIIVGIYNTGKQRIAEYTPTRAPKLGGGRAKRYAQFLIDELRPFIDNEYRTHGDCYHTGLGGSSLGGLVSLFIGLKHPNRFNRIAALSPSVWWHQRVMLRFAATARVQPHPRIWLDIGTREGPNILRDVENFRDVLIKKGWQLDHDLHYERVEGAEHNESAWAARIGQVLQFLYPSNPGSV
jgi:predicted alpha/beta superfamily hydrolase